MIQIAIICGGPSAERGISMNSARSVYDHLSHPGVQFLVLYVDQLKNFYNIEGRQLYSNTPSDFDFKIAREGRALSPMEYGSLLQDCDVAFPCIHGEFGEDGELQHILEGLGVPFVGSDSQACRRASDKLIINQTLSASGHPALKVVGIDLTSDEIPISISDLFGHHGTERVVLKPRSGGSSIGVKIVTSMKEAEDHAFFLRQTLQFRSAIAEEYCAGKEFTVVVIQSSTGVPVALPPTEVIFEKTERDIFTYRRKYLATSETRRPCPPETIDLPTIDLIRQRAEDVFTQFNMRDMARIDGFLGEDGRIFITDINPVSGMEQNSFIFQQCSQIGWQHSDLLRHLVSSALLRAGKPPIPQEQRRQGTMRPVWVLFGGDTAEKEVSVMSGTNVWLKLIRSETYEASAHLLTGNTVWKLPYAYCLDHTVGEILRKCKQATTQARLFEEIRADIRSRLGVDDEISWSIPEQMSLETFADQARACDAFVFLGLHGGPGEDGTIQRFLDSKGIDYNGCDAACSSLCMDKYDTGLRISSARIPGLISAPKIVIGTTECQDLSTQAVADLWDVAVKKFSSRTLLVKPRYDGCSCGIVHLSSPDELKTYLDLMGGNEPALPGTFAAHSGIVEMNFDASLGLLLEPFIETEKIQVVGMQIVPESVDGWIELTVGVVKGANGIRALTPSMAIADGAVLSLEEKFQGGTGVNLTPPMESIVSAKQIDLIREQVVNAAKVLGITGYARIDIFFHTKREDVLVIEANTLPGLTPSTVIYHQALAEDPPMTPRCFLEHLICTKANVPSRMEV